MTKRIQTFIKFIPYLLFSILQLSCRKDAPPIATPLKTYSGSLKFEFVPGSVEKIFSSQMPWEARMLNYYNVVKKDTSFSMWYNAFAYNQIDFNGSFCFADSKNGNSWNRLIINNSTNILLAGNNSTGVAGTFVFIDEDDHEYPYKMLCTKLVDGEQKTFLYTSKDGKAWKVEKKLYDVKQDTQFGVVKFNGLFYIFLRYNDFSHGYQRAIGLSILDKSLNTVQPPKLLLEAGINSAFPHIYNNAASKINDTTTLLFPTYFNEEQNTIRIKLICTNNMQDYYLVDDDITNTLFPNKDVNWGTVSPGVIPADEKDTYWVYYSGSDAPHNGFARLPKINVTYYRIKLVVHQ
jgi:hypothetical protein